MTSEQTYETLHFALYDSAFHDAFGKHWSTAPQGVSREWLSVYTEAVLNPLLNDPVFDNPRNPDRLIKAVGCYRNRIYFFRIFEAGRDARGRPGRILIATAFDNGKTGEEIDSNVLFQELRARAEEYLQSESQAPLLDTIRVPLAEEERYLNQWSQLESEIARKRISQWKLQDIYGSYLMESNSQQWLAFKSNARFEFWPIVERQKEVESPKPIETTSMAPVASKSVVPSHRDVPTPSHGGSTTTRRRIQALSAACVLLIAGIISYMRYASSSRPAEAPYHRIQDLAGGGSEVLSWHHHHEIEPGKSGTITASQSVNAGDDDRSQSDPSDKELQSKPPTPPRIGFRKLVTGQAQNSQPTILYLEELGDEPTAWENLEIWRQTEPGSSTFEYLQSKTFKRNASPRLQHIELEIEVEEPTWLAVGIASPKYKEWVLVPYESHARATGREVAPLRGKTEKSELSTKPSGIKLPRGCTGEHWIRHETQDPFFHRVTMIVGSNADVDRLKGLCHFFSPIPLRVDLEIPQVSLPEAERFALRVLSSGVTDIRLTPKSKAGMHARGVPSTSIDLISAALAQFVMFESSPQGGYERVSFVSANEAYFLAWPVDWERVPVNSLDWKLPDWLSRESLRFEKWGEEGWIGLPDLGVANPELDTKNPTWGLKNGEWRSFLTPPNLRRGDLWKTKSLKLPRFSPYFVLEHRQTAGDMLSPAEGWEDLNYGLQGSLHVFRASRTQ